MYIDKEQYISHYISMRNKTLIKDKQAFIRYASEHTIPQIAEHFNLDVAYVKNYVGNHKIPHKKLDLWHGFSNSRLYTIYRGMLARCYNPKHMYYDLYGGRSIKVCELWKNAKKEFFDWAMVNGYSDDLQLDRIDCNGDYSPQNCRFVTNSQNQNNRRCTRLYKGIPIGLITSNVECNPLKLDWNKLYKRLTGDNGRLKCWGIVEALATPVTTIRGSHKILPIDKEAENIVKKGLAKYFPQVLE